MFTEDTFRRHAQEVLTLADQLAKARRLFKTEGGHLTQAGRSIVVEGSGKAWRQAKLPICLKSVQPWCAIICGSSSVNASRTCLSKRCMLRKGLAQGVWSGEPPYEADQA